MNTPHTFVRTLTAAERATLEAGRTSADPFTVRRSQILLASADRVGAAIGRVVGCTAPAVRNAIRAFAADGPGCLTAASHARKDPGRVWDRPRDEALRDLLHRRPREFGKPTSVWTLALAAEVCHARFCDGRPVSGTTEAVLGWVCRELAADGQRVFVLVWDNAAWHVSQRVPGLHRDASERRHAPAGRC